MITRFKIFENLNEGKPDVGDYVICKYKLGDYGYGSEKMTNFLENSIGKIVLNMKDKNNFDYLITFDNIPKRILKFFRTPYAEDKYKGSVLWFGLTRIKFWSKDKEELEALIQANKYNL